MRLNLRTVTAAFSLAALAIGVAWVGGNAYRALAQETRFLPPPPEQGTVDINLERARLAGPRVFDGVIGIQVRRNP